MYPRLFELGPVTVYTYGVLLAAAYLLGLKLAMVRAKARGLDANRVLDLGIYIIISALIGAKLLLLITDFKTFTANPRELLTLARSGGGLGIGLNLVRQVLELHGGRIEARSAGLGMGTEFVVRLPGSHQRAVAAPVSLLQVPAIPIPAAAIAARARRGRTRAHRCGRTGSGD